MEMSRIYTFPYLFLNSFHMYEVEISVLSEQNPLHVEYLSIIVGFCVLLTDAAPTRAHA